MSIIFVSYAREDQKLAELVVQTLDGEGLQVWQDVRSLLPGERWDPIIRKMISQSTSAVFLASRHSLNKESYVQEELTALISRADELPDDHIYLIIARIDDVVITDKRLLPFNWVDIRSTDPESLASISKIARASWCAVEQTEKLRDLKADGSLAKTKNDRKAPPSPSPPVDGTRKAERSFSRIGLVPLPPLFATDEFDIYVNKRSKGAWIFHGKSISYDISHLVYVAEDHSIIVVMKDGARFDLGAKLQWLVRPHFIRAKEVQFARTASGRTLEHVGVPLRLGIRRTHGKFAWPNFRGLNRFVLVFRSLSGFNEEKESTPETNEEMFYWASATAWLIGVGCLALLGLMVAGAFTIIRWII